MRRVGGGGGGGVLNFHVKAKKWLCHLYLCNMLPTLHVEFKEWSCVEFRKKSGAVLD